MITVAWAVRLWAAACERWQKRPAGSNPAKGGQAEAAGPQTLQNPYRRFYTQPRRLEELRPAPQPDKRGDSANTK